MSYDVRLVDAEGEVLPTEHFTEGGTYNLYGTNACDLNITYNYAEVLRLVSFSVWDLHGKTAGATLEELRRVVDDLGGNQDRPPRPFRDYWAPTPGNALAAIRRLLVFAEEHPTGTWDVL